METPVKTPLNDAQLAILKLFSTPLKEDDVIALKRLLVTFLNERLQNEFDKIIAEKGYTQDTFDNWLNDPNQ
jgi:hypothetical protein